MLVRGVEAPHENLVVCTEHLRDVANGLVIEELPATHVSFWELRCAMCGVDPSPGRSCENESCRRPLHPRWPAVYCCNECALEDI